MKNSSRNLVKAGVFSACLVFLVNAGPSRVSVDKTPESGYFLRVNGNPFLVRGVIYNPTPIGEGYDYNLFIDPAKPWTHDGALMKDMGVNAVRIYSCCEDLERMRTFIREMYEKFGIYTIVGDWLGLWEFPAPAYGNPEFRRRIKEKILNTVKALKDEEGVLLWVLGNENNYTFSGKIAFWTSPEIDKIEGIYPKVLRKAEIYYSFVNDIAGAIKEIDPNHPVAMGNGDVAMLNIAGNICKNIDLLAINSYRGKNFGSLFSNVKYNFDCPVLVAEFGCDSYDAYHQCCAEDIQSEYLQNQWQDILNNSVFSGNKKGTCLGGAVFEWTDEWWKHNEGYTGDWRVHNPGAGWSEGAYYFDIKARDNLNMNEEWFGLISLDNSEESGINPRLPKKAFFVLKQLWTADNNKSFQ